MRLVVAGASYMVGDRILVPCRTGEFVSVDCMPYVTEEELRNRGYSDEFIEEAMECYIEDEGVKYYQAEVSPYHIDDDWDLISDLSDLFYCG